MVSVLIPTFNRSAYLRNAIASVLNQTYKDLEVIVVDDGSADDTQSVLATFGNKITSIRQANLGVSAARNRGLAVAQGKWIAFLDSDDEWHKDKMQIQMDQLEKCSVAIGHMCNAAYLKGSDEVTELFKLRRYCPPGNPQLEKKPFGVILSHSLASLQCSLVRRDMITRLEAFDPQLAIYEDLDFLLRIATEGSFIFDQTVLVSIIRRHEGAGLSLTDRAKADEKKRHASMIRVLEKFIDQPPGSNERVLLRHVASNYCFSLAMAYDQKNELDLSRSMLKKSWRYNPSFKSGIKYLMGTLPLSFGHRLYRAMNAVN